MSLPSMPGSSQYSSAPPFRAVLTIIAGIALPPVVAVTILAYGVSRGWWGTDPHQVRMSARFLAVAFSIVFSWSAVAGFVTRAVWQCIASVWFLRLAVVLPASLIFSILNWQRSGKLLLTVTAAQGCGFLVGVWLAAEIWTGQAARVTALMNGVKNWPWNLRDSISLALGIPACAMLLILHDFTSIVYISAAVLCVVTPLPSRTWEGALTSLSWCLLSILVGLPLMAAAGYLGRLFARLTSMFTGARRNADG
jgi:hypothetical protein